MKLVATSMCLETGDENLRLGSKKCTNMVIIRFYSIFWLGMATTRYFSFILHLYEAIQTICIGWMALLFQIVKHLHNKILINFFLLDFDFADQFLHKLIFFQNLEVLYFVVIPESMGVHRYPWFQNWSIKKTRAEVQTQTDKQYTMCFII